MSTSDLYLEGIEANLRDWMDEGVPGPWADMGALIDEVRRLRAERDEHRERGNENFATAMKWRAERDELHDDFECERCKHNVHHPPGDRCEIDDEGVEFCTFLVCGRCTNEQHAREKRERDRLRDGIRDVLLHRNSDLPTLGYLRDNDKSRAALAHLAALLDGSDTHEDRP